MKGLIFQKWAKWSKKCKKKAKEIEEANANKEYSVKSGGGLVAIKINGNGEVMDLNIDDSLFEDKESLQILLISAMNDAVKLIENEKKQTAAQMLGLGNLGNFGL